VPSTYFLQQLLSFLPDIAPTTCEQYFSLLNALLQHVCDSDGDHVKKFHYLVEKLATMIKERPIIEVRRQI
jgi:hypothetical protein